jgi:hypothetical protein
MDDLTKKLLPYQVPHLLQLYECLKSKDRVIDASDTGTGKTYTAIAVAKMLKCKPFIICPKSVVTNWILVCKYFDIKILGIANYEMIKSCKYYTENYEIVKCPYMDKEIIKKEKHITPNKKEKILEDLKFMKNPCKDDLIEIFKMIIEREQKEKEDKIKDEYVPDFNFYLPKKTLVILDEAHRCKNLGSLTSKVLLALNKNNVKIMLLSATLSDKLECFKPFGVILGIYKEARDFQNWMKCKIKYLEIINKTPLNYKDDLIKIKILHNTIFPNYGSRMKIKELGDMFPQNSIISNCYFLQNHDEVDQEYEEINKAITELKNKENKANILVRILRARQKIEMLKVALILDLIEEATDNENSVVIFVNYRDTLVKLKDLINSELDRKDISLIMGQQNIKERDENINKFQSNTNKIMICMIQAGNVGISLHDLHGGHPRISIISPSWSGQDMKQVFGRIHRAGSKSASIQKLVYVYGTYEEKICDMLKNKIRNIDGINDGDFSDPKIEKEELEEINKYDILMENVDLENIENGENKKIKVKKFKKKEAK